MPANIQKIFAGGFDMVQWGIPGDEGIVRGIVGGDLAQDASSGLGRIYGAKTANLQVPQGDTLVGTGDDGLIGVLVFATTAPIEFDLDVGQFNLDAAEATTETAQAYDEGDWTFFPLLPGGDTFNQLCLILTARALSKASGSDGIQGFFHTVLPLNWVQYLGPSGFNERGEMLDRFHVVANVAGRFPWGPLFGSSTIGVDEASALIFYSTKRFTVDTWRADGVEDDFDLAKTPVVGWAGGSGVDNRVRMFRKDYATGVVTQEDPDTVTVATGNVIIDPVTPPTADDLFTIAYEYTGK